jgi:RNA polymerase sigma factor (sigma-70 family)
MCLNSQSGNYGFSLLVRKYQKQVYWHIRRMVIDHNETDDLVQETFVKVWRNLKSFRGESMLYTWIYKIATNETLSYLQKRKLKNIFLSVDPEKQLAAKLQEDQYFSGDDIQIHLQKAIHSLPRKQRLVFNMKYYDEMKYEEMSEVLGTSVGALKASYHHAVKKIEDFMKNI